MPDGSLWPLDVWTHRRPSRLVCRAPWSRRLAWADVLCDGDACCVVGTLLAGDGQQLSRRRARRRTARDGPDPCLRTETSAEAHTGRVGDLEDRIARLRLTGSRFEGDGTPIGALPELVAYQELVGRGGQGSLSRLHPGRQRMPRGFTDRLQLRLVSVEQGSAIPVLERVREPGTLLPCLDSLSAWLRSRRRLRLSWRGCGRRTRGCCAC
jgi:hypothetical protein